MTGDTLVVDDDGVGPAVADAAPGNGLRGLTERARQAGARVEVSASPLRRLPPAGHDEGAR